MVLREEAGIAKPGPMFDSLLEESERYNAAMGVDDLGKPRGACGLPP
jgi:hypothetical protein